MRETQQKEKIKLSKKEIQELKEKSRDNQGERQPLQKILQLFSWKQLEPANEEQSQQTGQPQGKYKELEDKVVFFGTSEFKELLAEIIQQHRGE